jgi:pimeloyl-ACP methyl ester carboxylesterase
LTRLRFDKVLLSTGPRLHYAEEGAPDGEGVVFLHGWPDSWFTFSLVLPMLPPHLRLLAPDQRGFGASDKPESGYRIPDVASDVVAFLDALEIDRVTLVGHSFGSFVARHVAITTPSRCCRHCCFQVRASFASLSHSVSTSLRKGTLSARLDEMSHKEIHAGQDGHLDARLDAEQNEGHNYNDT